MSRIGEAVRRIARDQRGVTLIELLVAAMLGLMVVGTGVFLFTATLKSEPRSSTRGSDIQDARATMERVTRELRQGASIVAAAPSQLSIITYVQSAACGGASASNAIPCRVTYSCASGTCTRTERNPNDTGGGMPRTVVTGLAGSDVFTYSPSPAAPTYVEVTFEFPAGGGEDTITVSDGVSLRNSAVAR